MPLRIRIQNAIERAGLRQFAQFLRYIDWMSESIPEFAYSTEWALAVVKIERLILETVQKESYLLEQYQLMSYILRITGETRVSPRILEWNEKLRRVDEKYWSLVGIRQIVMRMAKNDSGIVRAYNSWRRQPQWHLHGRLRLDCAERGGCCGRDCGCCERPRSQIRTSHYGHCTSWCLCCRRHRGFSLNEDESRLADPIDTSNDWMTSYHARLMFNAYFLGLDDERDLMEV